MEKWNTITGYELCYSVSSYGKIKNIKRNKIISGSNHNGYRRVNFYTGKKRECLLVHRLVAIEFIENTNNLPHINHIDRNRSNNKVDNLEWCTQADNNRHFLASGRNTAIGERNGQSVLTAEKVLLIRSMRNYSKKHFGTIWLSKCFKVSTGAIDSICKNKTWRHL